MAIAPLTSRMLPLNVTAGGALTGRCGSPNPADPSARFYTASGGQTIDAQGGPDADASVLVSQGFAIVAPSGTTAFRNAAVPNYFKAGQLFVDLTLGRVIMFDGLVWRDVVTANVV
jgi:hypothetical protein